MDHSDLAYLNCCKRLIEENIGWQSSADWKHRDYRNLVELIEEKTGVLLSVSTLRRIWDPEYTSTPQVGTLNALAQFLDHVDWLNFKKHINGAAGTIGEGHEKKDRPESRGKNWVLVVAIALILVSGVISMGWLNKDGEPTLKNLTLDPGSVRFNAKNPQISGVPNTVVFDYDVSGVEADSFLIQQSWDPRMRDKIPKEGSTLTTTYYYPGPHTAKLIANDSVIQETKVNITTENWVGMAIGNPMLTVPTIIGSDAPMTNGNLHITKEQLLDNKVAIDKNTAVGYYYVPRSGFIHGERFTVRARIRSDSLLNLGCPKIGVMVLGENDYHAVTLVQKGCGGEALVKLGENLQDGKFVDLSKLTCDVFQWQSLTMEIRDLTARLYLNGEVVHSTGYSGDIGNILGFSIYFSGSGQIDHFELRDGDGKTVYRNDFAKDPGQSI